MRHQDLVDMLGRFECLMALRMFPRMFLITGLNLGATCEGISLHHGYNE